jgi:dTDP-glucose pyrophosphorylase
MNIIIPLGGKGERFTKEGYTDPKALIPIFDKTMIEYVIDNLNIKEEDKITIIYNKDLDKTENFFPNFILNKYPTLNIYLIKLDRNTAGAAETLYIGLDHILKNEKNELNSKKCIILDCDTFYTEDILSKFRNEESNAVFYTEKINEPPIYSYIELGDNSKIINIAEKIKISNNANTGCYAFQNMLILRKFCKKILDEKITFNGECYTSCVIASMIIEGEPFVGCKLNSSCVFSLGTPKELNAYIEYVNTNKN